MKHRRYIDANALKKQIKKSAEVVTDNWNWYGISVSKAITLVEDAPAADVRENVHAHWDRVEMKKGEWWHTCSKCKATWGSEDGELDFNFCPNCGAQMDKRRGTDV